MPAVGSSATVRTLDEPRRLARAPSCAASIRFDDPARAQAHAGRHHQRDGFTMTVEGEQGQDHAGRHRTVGTKVVVIVAELVVGTTIEVITGVNHEDDRRAREHGEPGHRNGSRSTSSRRRAGRSTGSSSTPRATATLKPLHPDRQRVRGLERDLLLGLEGVVGEPAERLDEERGVA